MLCEQMLPVLEFIFEGNKELRTKELPPPKGAFLEWHDGAYADIPSEILLKKCETNGAL